LERTRIEARLQSLEDSFRRMSIWPLLEAGEFSAISDAGISREDLMLTRGKLAAYMEAKIKQMPEPFKTAGRYGIVSKDTAAFQGLQKAVQYGDFVAKAILYDDMTQRQKKTQEETMGRITEEFVNYDRLPGRFRAYAEDMGLLWFYNFKIRSVKVALSIIRNNPVHAMLMIMMPEPPIDGVGTVLGDNLVSKIGDGSLARSIGPWMGFSAPALNPWAYAINSFR